MGVDQRPRRDWTGTRVSIGIGWTMRRSRRTALHLALYTDPLGWDLPLEGQHALPRSRICRTKERRCVANPIGGVEVIKCEGVNGGVDEA
jgi:hypothetical protein